MVINTVIYSTFAQVRVSALEVWLHCALPRPYVSDPASELVFVEYHSNR